MRSTTSNVIIGLLTAAATILAALISVYATRDSGDRGSSPPKRLVINSIGVVDPLVDLRAPGTDLTISVKAANADISTLRLAQVTISNAGKSPIVPSDFVEPLTVSTTPPWRIVAVANAHRDISTLVPLAWAKVSDTKFVARPTLLNPGDQTWVAVYLANDETSGTSKLDDPTLSWSARIVNLRAIETAPDTLATMQQKLGWIQVNIWSWGVPFILLSFGIYVSLSLLLFSRAGLFQPFEVPAFG